MSKQIEFEGLCNVRDLGGTAVEGGLIVKSGLMLRSDQLADATETDLAKLGELGIRKVIDLRSGAGVSEKPDPELPGARYVHLPIIKDVRAGITRDSKSDARIVQMLSQGQDVDLSLVDEYMSHMYHGFVDDEYATSQYARFVDELIDCVQHGQAVLWHCTAGKDRAGFATVIVLEALGASRADILADYLKTNECISEVVDRLIATLGQRLPSDSARTAARRFFLANERYLAASYEQAEKRYGSFHAFSEQALGIDASKRALMRELLCE